MKSISWMLGLSLLVGCLSAEGDPPDARPPVTDALVIDAPPFEIPDAAPRPDAKVFDAAVPDAAPE